MQQTVPVWSWKLSRTRQLSVEGSAAIDDAIAKVDVLKNDYYENIQQTDTACFHLPDIPPGDNVVLPGRCDLSIRGMSNFNLNRVRVRILLKYITKLYSSLFTLLLIC